MNELQIFNSEEFGDIRTVTIENEPWFVGKDVAEALGYSNATFLRLSLISALFGCLCLSRYSQIDSSSLSGSFAR